ncbi:hypothetical protein BD779DRAFT_1667921 [Infundibulicybe gibba]|nr:hypothetical protein BD779DRAFT_1667921 [Infundibulicybe gibba]
MQNRIKIVTTPPSANALPPLANCVSPTTKKPAVQYRIEERTRTIYVTSDRTPAQWDPQQLNQMFAPLQVASESEHPDGQQSVRRSKSLVEQQVFIVEPSSSQGSSQSHPSHTSVYRSRRPGTKSVSTLRDTLPESPGQGSSPTRQCILFYHKHDPYYGFTNFSAHPVTYKGKRYPTSEHLFQSFKFQAHRPGLAEHIRTCSERPSVAFSEARRFQPEVRPDWKDVNIQKMDETLWLKFTQNHDLRAELLGTGDAELIEDSDKDAFWGVGADRKGRNELGKALERLRTKLREANYR